mmetsp:Transcript_42799/g.126795  ORF Transcript_42799/g.126795 Transcript_42799/m.126795 type:complete len:203 (-) Transcript_42799:1389-1997(-)
MSSRATPKTMTTQPITMALKMSRSFVPLFCHMTVSGSMSSFWNLMGLPSFSSARLSRCTMAESRSLSDSKTMYALPELSRVSSRARISLGPMSSGGSTVSSSTSPLRNTLSTSRRNCRRRTRSAFQETPFTALLALRKVEFCWKSSVPEPPDGRRELGLDASLRRDSASRIVFIWPFSRSHSISVWSISCLSWSCSCATFFR